LKTDLIGGNEMNISRQKCKELYFEFLNSGDLFMYKEQYYMKTYTLEHNGTHISNAVNIQSGSHALFANSDKLYPVEYELIIK
jgi:hypothetical protein